MDIYWIKDKKRLGPEPEVVIISMLQREELSLDTPAWHKGCSGWMPLEELPALSSYFKGKKTTSEIEKEGDVSASGSDIPEPGSEVKVILMMTPSPYVRVLARMADLYFYFWLVTGALFFFSPESVKDLFDPKEANAWHLAILSYGWIIVEAVCLRFFGTTLGKWIMGIQVYSMYQIGPWKGEAEIPVRENASSRGNLTFMQALVRTLFVYAFGLGFLLNLPLMVIAGLFSLFILRKTGTTMWDGNARTVEIYRGFRPWDILILLGVMFGLALVLSFAMVIVSPEMVQYLFEKSREFYGLPVK